MTLSELKQQAEQSILINDPEGLLECVNHAHLLDKHLPDAERPTLKAHVQRWRGIRSYIQGEYSSALKLLDEAFAMYRNINNVVDSTRVILNIGAVHYYLGEYSIAYEYYQRAHNTFSEIGDEDGVGVALGNIANIYMANADYSRALEWYGNALQIHRRHDNKHRIALVVGNIGNIYKELSEYPQALEYFHEALSIYEQVNDRSGIARVTSNIAGVYYSTSDFPAALEFFHKALAIQEELGDRFRIARQFSNIAGVYFGAGEHATALEWHERSLKLQEEIGDRSGISHVTGSIGVTYAELGRMEEAEEWLRRSLQLIKPFGHRREEAFFSNSLCGILIKRGALQEAQAIIDEGIAMSVDLPEPRIGFLECKSAVLQHHGEHEHATTHLEQALELAYRHGLRNQQIMIHRALRESYRDKGPLEQYVKHTEAIESLIKETTGIEQQRKLAIATVERRVSHERKEAERHRALLHNVMPEAIASRILKGENLIADELEDVAVFFLDLVSFTELSSRVAPGHLVYLLNAVFNACDDVMRLHGLTKIKTIGDAYMAVAGAPTPVVGERGVTYENAYASAMATLDLRDRLDRLEVQMPEGLGDTTWVSEIGKLQVRMGLNIGALVAGVVGTDRVAYDVWGDAVNVAARMEQSCEPGFIQVSDEFARALSRSRRPDVDEAGRITLAWDHGVLVLRGSVSVKGKGDIKTWWLERTVG